MQTKPTPQPQHAPQPHNVHRGPKSAERLVALADGVVGRDLLLLKGSRRQLAQANLRKELGELEGAPDDAGGRAGKHARAAEAGQRG